MRLTRIKDLDFIYSFMTKDEVWNTFADDMSDKMHYVPSIDDDHLWLYVDIDGEFIGLLLVNNYNLNTFEAHPYLLKPFRRHIRTLFTELLKIIIKAPYFINKLMVTIPFNRRIVYNTAKKFGFIDEGINRGSYLKNGVFYDQWYLGLTRKEMEELVWQKQ